MTDNEIIKALECCVKSEEDFANCGDCPYHAKGMCLTNTEIFDLINRQKAEIERLQSILLCFMDEVSKWENKHGLDISELPLIPIKGESEKIIQKTKAEATKEFAENLKSEKTTAISCDLFEEVVRLSDVESVINKTVVDAE